MPIRYDLLWTVRLTTTAGIALIIMALRGVGPRVYLLTSQSMTIHHIRLKSGEVIDIRETADGPVCPVCGFASAGDPPYGLCRTVLQDGSLGESYGAASFDVCPSCGTEYGNDDYAEGQTVTSMWDQLRIKWLDRAGWSDIALKQLQDHLNLTQEELERGSPDGL